MKKFITFFLCIIFVFSSVAISFPKDVSADSERNVIIASLRKNKIKYVNCDYNYNYRNNVDWGFNSLIGYGKRKSIKLSKKCKFYKIDYSKEPFEYKKISKRKFRKLVKSYSFSKFYFNGFTKNGRFIEVPYFKGLITKLVIRNRKVIKVYQINQ